LSRGFKIALTSDRATFTDFNGVDALGFGLCVPCRLLPKLVEYKILAPPIPSMEDGRALYAPYPLAKVEASLIASGFSRDEVAIVPPEVIEKTIGSNTKVVGVHTIDPQGLAPVSWTLRVMLGGGITCTAYEFERLMFRLLKLKEKFGFKLIVGGPGAWQLEGREEKFGIDALYEGEAEVTFPNVVKKILKGESVPKRVYGNIAPVDKIPPAVTPSRNGIVQITRGCPRGCQFCSPTTFFFRSIPMDTILKEVKLNLDHGAIGISFATEDVLLYGAKGLSLNSSAVEALFRKVLELGRKYGLDEVSFSHVTLSSALVLKNTVKFITDINGFSRHKPTFPQIGMESGSPRIVAKYFRGKPYPWKPEEWPEVVINATKLLNDNYWYPCLTYIIGFPDATPDDYLKTAELIDRLRDEGFLGWIFPLFLIPIGGTRIRGKASFKILKDLPPEAIEAFVEGWKVSIKFSRMIYPYLLKGVKNVLAHRIVMASVDQALDSMNEWVISVARDPDIIARSFSQINIRELPQLFLTLLRNHVFTSWLRRRETPSLSAGS